MKFGMDAGKLQGALYNGLSSAASLKAVGAEGEYVGRLMGYYTEVTINDQKLGKTQTMLDVIPEYGTYNNGCYAYTGQYRGN